MDPQSILQVHAEVAMALGGFASVAAVLGRPLSALQRQRFLALLFLSLTQVLGCLVPLLIGRFDLTDATLWRLAAIVNLAIGGIVVVATVIIPIRRIGRANSWVIGPLVNRVLDTIAAFSFVFLVANAIGFPWSPNFAVYYMSLLFGFVVGFVLFADVILLPADSEMRSEPPL